MPPGGYAQPVPGLRAAGRLAACGSDPAAPHDAGLRPSDALAGGRGLPGGRDGPGGPGQSEHPPPRFPLRELHRELHRRRGPAHRKTAGVPLHAQARQLAEPRIKYGAAYGGDRVQRTGPLLPPAASPRRGCPPPENPGLGVGAQHGPCHHQLAVQHPGRQNQTPPPLPLSFQR